jgi:hypothetical protein
MPNAATIIEVVRRSIRYFIQILAVKANAGHHPRAERLAGCRSSRAA